MLAHFIDDFVFWILVPILGSVAFLRIHQEEWIAILVVLMLLLYLLKDGRGLSVGKLFTGIEVVDVRTAKPAGYLASLKRNIPLLIPFVPLIIALQIPAGVRLGDGWAHTRVVLKKYRDKSPFRTVGFV